MKTISIAIEASSKWPEGDYPLINQDSNDPLDAHVGLRSFSRISRKTLPTHLFPAVFDPVGTMTEGPVSIDEVVVETLGGFKFNRFLLDTVRAAFPGVLWCVHKPKEDIGCAYACLAGRVVAIVASRVFV